MIDSVKFASEAEVVAYVEAALAKATAPEWDWRSAPEDRELLSWVVFPVGEQPRWNNRWVLHAARSGEYFVLIHGNETRGMWRLEHGLQNATFISRFTLGMTVGPSGRSTLALALRHLFETTTPNVWDPT
jgi:hypothetical protein